jgi:hypothetical protein
VKLVKTMGGGIGLHVELPQGPRIIDIAKSLGVFAAHGPVYGALINGTLKERFVWAALVNNRHPFAETIGAVGADRVAILRILGLSSIRLRTPRKGAALLSKFLRLISSTPQIWRSTIPLQDDLPNVLPTLPDWTCPRWERMFA